MKRLLIVGASAYQHYIYTTARQSGLWICAFDADPDAPMFRYCNQHRALDFAEVPAVASFARDIGVDAVATINLDQGMRAVASLQQMLGLPGLSTEAATQATRKDLMRQTWEDAGISQPYYRVFGRDQHAEALSFARTYPERLIVKPVDNAAKRGISVVHPDSGGVEGAIEKAFDASVTSKVIIEEFIEGTLIFAATYLRRRGREPFVQLMKQYTNQELVQLRFEAPFTFGDQVDSKVKAEALRAARCFGSGPFHTEIIVTASGIPYLVETSPRVSYATVSLSRLVAGFDPVAEVINDALDSDEVATELEGGGCAVLEHLEPREGAVFRPRTPLPKMPAALHEIVPVVPEGFVVQRFATNEDRVGYFTVSGRSRREVDDARTTVRDVLLTSFFG